MNKSQIEIQIEKTNRLHEELFRNLSAYGFEYSVEEKYLENNEQQSYSFPNLKNPTLHRDNAIAVCGCIRDFRDYCIKELMNIGKSDAKKIVNEFMQNNTDVQICSDIVNADKHNGTDPQKRWIKKYIPKLSEPGFEIDGMKAIKQITISAGHASFDLSQDDGVKITLFIIDEFENKIDDAYDVIFRAKAAWIDFCRQNKLF